jgi:hypothetical protein
MRTRGREDNSGNGAQTVGATPDAVLAQQVIDALVADGLISEVDGASIRADLADGKVDSARWKMVLENKIEREGRPDERK